METKKKLSEINDILLKEIIKDEQKTQSLFLKYKLSLDNLSNSLNLVNKIQLSGNPFNREIYDVDLSEKILISTLLSDVTRIYPGYAFSSQFKLDNDCKIYEEEINNYLNKEYGLKKGEVISLSLTNLLFREKDAEFLRKNFLPLFESERLTVSLDDYVIFQYKTKSKITVFSLVPIEFNQKEKLWTLPVGGDRQKEIPFSTFYDSVPQNSLLKNILIPYIKGLEISEFAKILDAEQDLLGSFRVELKQLSKFSFDNSVELEQIFQDKIKPKIDKINRKFNSICQIHKFKVRGVTLATTTLSLISMAVGNYIGAIGTMITAASGSTGLIKFEEEYQTELNTLKGDPMYLLWKLSKTKRSQ